MTSKIKAIIKNKKVQKLANLSLRIMNLLLFLMIGLMASTLLNIVDFNIIDINTQTLIIGACAATFFLSIAFTSFTCFIFGLGDRK